MSAALNAWILMLLACIVQRYTAYRIFERIRKELPKHKVAKVTVRLYMWECKQELGLSHRATWGPRATH